MQSLRMPRGNTPAHGPNYRNHPRASGGRTPAVARLAGPGAGQAHDWGDRNIAARRCRPEGNTRVERRVRLFRPPLDDGGRDPRFGRKLLVLPRELVAVGRAPRRVARDLRDLYARPHPRPAHHGPDGYAAGIHEIVL